MSTELIRSLMPLIIIEFGAVIIGLGHLFYKKKTRNLNVWMWAGIIVVFNLFGALAYFVLGRDED